MRNLILNRFLLSFIVFCISYLTAGNVAHVYAESSATVWQWNGTEIATQKEGLDNVVSVKNGFHHTLVLRSDGTVWSWGSNANGQLGIGTIGGNSDTPVQVKGMNGEGNLTDVIEIAVGDASSMALKKDGSVWVWGQNQSGSLGTGIGLNDQNSIISSPLPVKMNGNILTGIKEIASGSYHFLALKSDGTVLTWGVNDNGQLGQGCYLNSCSRFNFPVQISSLNNVIDISAGSSHSIAVKSDGSVWGWGRTYEGELGPNSLNSSAVQATPFQIQDVSNIKSASAGRYHTLALSSDGKLFQWGGGPYSTHSSIQEIHINDNSANITQISAGWNNGQDGQPGTINLVLDSSGSLWQWRIDNNNPERKEDLQNVTKIAAGNISTPNIAIVGNPTPFASPTQAPFMTLPFDYKSKGETFDQVALNPESWFDHKYPLQNVPCCTDLVTKYDYNGQDAIDAYRSHSGYDYAYNNGVILGTPVLAVADGMATFEPEAKSGGGGNVIKIDHGNGYESIYEHLALKNLVISSEGESVYVNKGQQIGQVGMTGNTNGPHIHLSVIKNDNNNTFADDNPIGLVDPLGWEGKDEDGNKFTDPWTQYTINGRHGPESVNLFLERNKPIHASIPTTGGSINLNNIQITVPSNATPTMFTVDANIASYESQENLVSAMPSFYLYAFNSLGDSFHKFFEPIQILYSYASADLQNIKEDTLKLYYFNPQTSIWEALPSTLDVNNKTIAANTNHFSHFALMGEAKDTIAPMTTITIDGDKGQDNWYRSAVTIKLIGSDNQGGLGLLYTLYSLDGKDWDEYTSPIVVDTEGEHTLSYQSFDKANNKEGRSILNFHIDKTPPVVSITATPDSIWSPNGKMIDVKVDGSSSDDHLEETTFNVQDEYHLVEPSLTHFGQTIELQAKRDGNDLDGRVYTIEAIAEDLAGNRSVSDTTVTVPHDNSLFNYR